MSEHRKLTQCPNCGTALREEDNFCPHCGQENHSLRVPFKHLLLEVTEGLLHFDSKSLRTVNMLVRQPGRLTAEFSAGRRASLVPPIRLYIFISFLFFFLIAISTGKHDEAPSGSEASAAQGSKKESNKVTLTFLAISSDELEGMNRARVDSLMDARGVQHTPLNQFVTGQLARIASGGKAEFNHMLLKGISNMMFVLMPFFALLLLLFYRKRAGYYLDCLVFSVHFHSFVFLLFIAFFLLSWLMPSIVLIAASAIVVPAYLFLSLKTVYHQRSGITLVKTAAIGALHLVSIAVCFFATAVLSVVLF